MLILLFGIIDGGRFMWEATEAEKATQMGARMAVVTNPVAGGLNRHGLRRRQRSQGRRPHTGERVRAIDVHRFKPAPAPACPGGLLGTYNSAAFDGAGQRAWQT